MSKTLPQQAYFLERWAIPGTTWTLSGHSRALERTGFLIPEVGIVLDGGVDLPTPTKQPNMILITHTHIDHMGAIASLVRHQEGKDSLHIFAPRLQVHRLRQFVQLSFAVKVDYSAPLVDHYAPPPDSEAIPDVGVVISENSGRIWHPVELGETVAMVGGKKGGVKLVVKTLQLFHTISAIGYAVFELRNGVRPNLVGKTPKETGDNVKAAKARGENPNIEVEIPRLAFLCDTTAQALAATTPTSQWALSCPNIMIECTYLGPELGAEAVKRGHVWWGALLPFVKQQLVQGVRNTWILVHFSLRYTDAEILEFFLDPALSGLELTLREELKASEPARSDPSTRCGFCGSLATPPSVARSPQTVAQVPQIPNIVLWLDTGIKELFIAPKAACTSVEISST